MKTSEYRTFLKRLHNSELEDEAAKVAHAIETGMIEPIEGYEQERQIDLEWKEREHDEQAVWNALK